MPAVEDVVEAMTSAMTRIMKSSGWDLEVVIAFEPMARTSEKMDGSLQKLHVNSNTKSRFKIMCFEKEFPVSYWSVGDGWRF